MLPRPVGPRNRDLVRRSLAGDGDAFAEIVDSYRGRVYQVVRRHLSEPEDVEDTVQEVFCTAFQRLTSLRDPVALGAWLARIAANTSTQRLRRRRVRDRLLDMEPAEVLPTYRAHREGPPDDVILGLLDAVGQLPPPYLQTVSLFHFQGYTCQQVSDSLGISHSAVKWRLREARKRLRERLRGLVDAAAERPVLQS